MTEDQGATAVADDKLEQTVTIEDAGPACKKITIEIPETRINAKIEENFGTLKNDANIPGFRQGRAPRRLIEKRFGEAVRDDVKSQLLSESFTQATEDNDLDILGEPEVDGIEDLKLPESGPMTVVIQVEVTPDVELPDFSKIKVEKVKNDVTDEDVNSEIDQMRDRMGKMNPLGEGGVAQEGDFIDGGVKILAGENAGDDAEVLDQRDNVWVLINGEKQDYKGHIAGIVVEDLGKLLPGKKVGEVETISMTGPESHENEKIKGQPITIELTINELQRVELAEIEAVVEQMGAESEEQLRERIKEQLEGRAKQQQDAAMHEQIAEQLVELVDMELPEGISGRQTERVLSRRKMELLHQGKSEADAEQEIAEMRSSSEEDAQKQLKQFFIIDKAAKDLEIEVDEQELNGQIAMMAYQQGRRPEKMRQEMMKSGQLEQLFLNLREHQTLAKICEQATVTEVDKASDA